MSDNKLDIHQLLSRQPLFQQLAPTEIDAIVPTCRQRRLTKGEMIFQKGDMPNGFFVVIFGQIKLAFPSMHGNEKVVNILGPRQSFGEAVMFSNRPCPVFAEALVDSSILHIAAAGIFELISRDHLFAHQMLAGLSMRLHALIEDVEMYSLRSSTQRVIGYLLLHCPPDCNSLQSVDISLPTSKQVIASRLNLTPETLSRIFNDLSSHGLIAVQGKVITVTEIKRLREFEQ